MFPYWLRSLYIIYICTNHALDGEERLKGLFNDKPINIGDNVWLGAKGIYSKSPWFEVRYRIQEFLNDDLFKRENLDVE